MLLPSISLPAPDGAATLSGISSEFLVFYSSIDGSSGKMWCPDCLRIEGIVDMYFAQRASVTATIIYVGQRQEWKDKANVARGEPWDVQAIPTIVRRSDGARLVEEDITAESLIEFINGSFGQAIATSKINQSDTICPAGFSLSSYVQRPLPMTEFSSSFRAAVRASSLKHPDDSLISAGAGTCLLSSPTLMLAPQTNGGTETALWQKIGERKRADREHALGGYAHWRLKNAVPPDQRDVSQVLFDELTAREISIVQCDATALLDLIHSRQYSAVEVVSAICHAATVAQDLTNCLTEIFYDDALKRAAELDDHLARTGEIVGPLHGLPVSIKDHILVKGKDTSTGYIAWAYKTVAKIDAVSVDILKRAGAVLFAKTNNPQTLLSLETNNNIFGRTTNPFNRDLTPGGSSGGESALIASFGSPLGLGTDIGGSIRIPAAHAGLYGFKASVARIPHAGLLGSHDGMDAIVGVLGPIARSVRDLSLFCKVMLHYEPWLLEPPLLHMPWKQDVVDGDGLPAKLCLAILWDDGVVAPHPPIKSALMEAKKLLVAAGHEIIDWDPIDHQEAWDLITKLYFLDGGAEYRDVLLESGEPPVPQTEWILKQVPNDGKPFTIAQTFRLNLQREAFRKKLLQHWNNTSGRTSSGRPIDGILCPVAPTLAPPHDSTRWWGYSSYWNLADYPAAVIPVGRLSSNDGLAPDAPQAYCNGHGNEPRNSVDQYVRDQWCFDRYENAPISLQLVGRRLNEERLLGMLGVVDAVLRDR